MKKIISALLVCLLILNIFLIQNFTAFASGFEPAYNLEYEAFINPEHPKYAEAQEKLQEARIYLRELIDSERNDIGQQVNEITFAMYGQIVYGFFSGDYKTSEHTKTGRTEYRYLGTNKQGNLVTNDYFPNDATGEKDLRDKDWQRSSYNVDTWRVLENDDYLKNKIYTTKDLYNDGFPMVPDYSLSDILSKKSSSYPYKQDYINLQAIPNFSTNGSARLTHKTSDNNTWYDTFTIPALGGDYDLNVVVSTPKNSYTIMPTENYIDIPVTVSLSVTVAESFLENYIAARWVKLDGVLHNSDTYTYTKRIYKSSLDEGVNTITFNGEAGINSVFPNDRGKTKSKNHSITVTVAEDKLIAQLDVPQTGAVNTPYTVKDVSYIPQGATVVSSRLEKKVAYGSFEDVSSWNGNSLQDSHPVKATITYRLTIILDNGQTGSDTKSIQILDSRSVDATADLILSEYTYEGHPAYARDDSVFDVEGETYYASQAYEAGLAENDFDVLESTPHSIERLSDTTAKITFQNRGYYNVRLDVFTQDGKRLFDIEPIEVRRTPYIEDNLGGTQKENRKQILNLSVAIKPSNPITNFWVEIEDTETGEKVHVVSSKNNSATIKTRDIISSSTEYFQNYILEFLTKNTTEKVYKYTAYVRDSKGDTDTVSEYFTVYPDLSPAAQIDMLDSYIRNQDSNIAEIIVEDGTVSSDGDQVERTWRIRRDTNNNNVWDSTEPLENMSAYNMKDLSFGSGQKVSFEKTGVGLVRVRLDVKEVWIEPTLEEYVTDADRKTGVTTKDVVVNNIAPMVSLKPIDTYKENVLILTTKKDIEQAKARKNALEMYLRENGLDSNIIINYFENENNQSATFGEPFLFYNKSEPQKEEWYYYVMASDNKNFYYVYPTSYVKDSSQYYAPVLPYIVEAYNLDTRSVSWKFSINKGNFDIVLDKEDKFVYLVFDTDNKLVILEKKTGALVADLPVNLKGEYYYTDKGIYVFNKNGIHKINLSNGEVKTIFNYKIENTGKVNGDVHFSYCEGLNLYRGIFKLNSESVQSEYLCGLNEYGFIEEYETLEIDNLGNMALIKLLKTNSAIDDAGYEYSYEGSYVIKVFNRENKEIFSKKIGSNWWSYTPLKGIITDESGKITDIYFVNRSQNSPYYYSNVSFYDIYNNKTVSITRTTDYGAHQKVLYAKRYNSKGEIYLVLDGNWSVYSGHWPYSATVRVNTLNYTAELVASDFSTLDIEEISYSDNYIISAATAETTYTNLASRYIQVSRQVLMLEDAISKALGTNLQLEEGYQKNVVIIDDINNNNTSVMQKVIDYLKNIGSKVIVVNKNLNENMYLKKIKNALSGNEVLYDSNMDNNLVNIGEIINSNKQDDTNKQIKISGNSSSNTVLSKQLKLDPGAEYVYEYDIKFVKKGSVSNPDIFNVTHQINNTANEGLSNIVLVPTGNEVLDTFDGATRNPFFTYSNSWRWRQGDEFLHLSSRNVSNSNETITFTLDKPAVLSFDYGYYMYDENHRFQILVDGVVELDRYLDKAATIQTYKTNTRIYNRDNEGSTDEWTMPKAYHFSKYLNAGTHTLELKYSKTARYNNTFLYEAFIDNLRIRYVTRMTNGSYDSGVFNKGSKTVKENEWQHISNTFRTPFAISKYVEKDKKQTFSENFADGIFDTIPYITVDAPEDFYISDGMFRSPDAINVFTVTFKVNTPSHILANISFSAASMLPTAGSRSIQIVNGDFYSSDTNKYYTFNGENKRSSGIANYRVRAQVGYQNTEPWDKANGYLAIKNFKAIFEPQPTSKEDVIHNGNLYVPAKKYTGNSSISLQANSTSECEILIKNFKLYKIIDGKKMLVEKFDTFYQEQLESLFTITKSNSQVSLTNEVIEVKEDAPMVYKKGQLVAYNIYYDDYESDPSKKQYWQYTHTPFNDGLHPDNEKILNAPIERFYIDGKYVVRHWQEDNTGVAAYDKNSNIQEITFFIQGNAIAPEVTYINTVPETVKDGNDYKIEIGVDDQDKDVLDTAIELYKNGTLIYTYTRNNVAPVGGVYPAILSGYAPTASPGNYTVVATASDGTGIGLRSYDFIVVSEGRIEGMVNHTDQWNQNRISFNLAKSGTENNPRSYNIFWSGEAFVLIAETEGNPVSVDVEILNEGFSTSLSSTNQTLWTGELWDESMINKWGRETPESLTFRFTAYFTGGITRTDDVTIIIDDRETFWRLHRLY